MERIYQGVVVLDRNYTINIIYIIIYIILNLSAKRNFKMQMSKVGNRESGKPHRFQGSGFKIQSFLKNNCRFSCTIREIFVPLHHRCKTDISIKKLRHSQRKNFC